MSNMLFILDFYVKNGLYQSKHDYQDKIGNLLYFTTLDTITIQDVHNYCDIRIKQGVKNATINREINIIRSAINYYNKHHDTNVKNPFNGFNLFESDIIPVYLTPAECQRLLQCCKRLDNPYFYAFISLLIYTGCRKGELLTLTWDNVYLDDRYLIIRNSLSKNKKTVYKPLNDNAIKVLQGLDNRTHWVFYNHKTKTHYKTFNKPWRTAKEMARIELRLHDLRHTFASLLIQQGVPLYHVSQLLGHSDTRITQRYAHLSPNNLQDVVKLLNIE